jgi:hypothetical protein
MEELSISQPYEKGARGAIVKKIQEWLCLNAISVAIDGQFGPATRAAVSKFQKRRRLPVTGVVDPNTYGQLVIPMATALQTIQADGLTLGQLVVAYARRHLAVHPREVGGQNRGPWVRLYLDGHEGAEWPWCAGFDTFMLKQASQSLEMTLALRLSFSCDGLAAYAREAGMFVDEPAAKKDPSRISPGSLFLKRRTSTDWVHTGIVESMAEDYMQTIEGNTNDEGSREGYEVCSRIRGLKGMDFIVV